MNRDLLKVLEVLHENNLDADRVINLLKFAADEKMSSALEKEELEEATELNKIRVSLNKLQHSL